jgi:hypothetical protein
MYISQTDVSGRQSIVLEPSQVKEIAQLVNSKKLVKRKDVKYGTKVTVDTDGGMYISQTSVSDKENIVLEPNQVNKIFRNIK